MDRLVALPIAGESFLLQRAGRNILVDGGYSSKALAAALSEVLGNSHATIDIVVCTHADSDHAGGLADILDKSNFVVNEFWLPGEWGDVLPELLSDPKRVADGLLRELNDAVLDDDSPEEDYEAHESKLHEKISAQRREQINRRSPEITETPSGEQSGEAGLNWLKKHFRDRGTGDEDGEVAAKVFESGRRKIRYRMGRRGAGANSTRFWVRAIDTAEAIRKIALQAVRHQVRVRWFDFNSFIARGSPSGGEAGLLVPWNAIELLEPLQLCLTMSFIARLSPVNEQSLVFCAPSDYPRRHFWWNPDIIFTGDSPLGTGRGYERSFLNRLSREYGCAIATAPHHGSENNAAAYSHLSRVRNVVLWLRSGGSSKQPGATFKSLPPANRLCMHCPQKRYGRQVAEIVMSHDDSDFPILLRVNSHHCCCN